MQKYKKVKIQRDPTKIRLDYLNITGAIDLKDLETNHPFYWKELTEELNRVSGFSIETEKSTNLISIPRKLSISNLADETFRCKKCKEELLYTIGHIKIYYQDTDYQSLKGISTVICKCGEKNIFNFNDLKSCEKQIKLMEDI